MALLKSILILAQLLPLVRTINTIFFPCDTDINETAVDCSNRRLRHVPLIKSTTVKSIDLSQTKIRHVGQQDFSGLPNLQTLKMMGNCQPGPVRAAEGYSCRMEIHRHAFKSLLNLRHLYLSGNSLTSIPWLPESLEVLDLQNNQIFNIVQPLNTPNLKTLLLTKNCFYVNPCNQSFNITPKVFKELHNLEVLYLGYNNLTAVPKGLPQSLKYLDLKENTISKVFSDTFSNMPNLTSLNLEWNCQRCDHAARPCFPCWKNHPLYLYPNSFYSKNSKITYLSLRGNSLEAFPEGLFKPLVNLKILDLSDNFLGNAIHKGTFFSELKGLTWISLLYNYQPGKTTRSLVLSPHFPNMSGLETLLLSGNFFRKLSNHSYAVLSKLQRLKRLELRMNFIETFNFTALNKLPSLIDIDLSQNMLNFLPSCSKHSFVSQDAQNQNSFTNDLADTPVMFVETQVTSTSDLCRHGQSNVTKTFEVNVTRIPKVWDFKDDYCRYNVTFDLSQNDIVHIDANMFEGMEKAVCLDLSFNYMSQSLKGKEFTIMTNLAYLNLSYNRLDLYYGGIFSELNNTLKVLDLSNNEFHFAMKGMGHRFGFITNLTNLVVLSLANNNIGMRISQRLYSTSLKYLYFSGNHLNIMWDSDNNKYIHFFQNLTNLIFLDISNNRLKSISPEVLCNLPGSIKVLSISDNEMTYFPWQNITALRALQHLNLSQNHLHYLPDKVLEFGGNFSLLDLSHNRISFLPKNLFSKAKSLKYLYLNNNQIKELNQQLLPVLLSNSSALHTLTLHDNPFKCDCDTSWFANFLRTTLIEIPHLTTNVKCVFPVSLGGRNILSVDQRSCQDIDGSLAFFVSSLFAVMFTVLPLLKHLYGWDLWYCLQVLWAGHKGYSQLAGSDSEYDYDAFVVFNTKNQAVRDWVYNELIIHLENSGHRRFCVCLEERDWIPGLSCIENLHNAVSRSAKTVFVLSSGGETVNGVIRQAFFMVQQRLLDEKADVAVMVLLDEMFPKLKYLQLRKRLCRKSVLSWPKNPRAQPLFWNQMRMALSLDNLKFYDNNMSESFL
ncbi:toll-like receptor 9 [Sphaeramia orbicularis]|uniref:Toll-like receptor 9 n=1 Tax=Sphaeramia orbicularis TaxID=375764 RepID=A0A673AMI1_9TELE|nr:toll-like receptor 9 [Sphaeramia orbicularis]